mgnify:CR=1 FL=1
MILTEEKTYTMSLEQEDCGSTTGLVNKIQNWYFLTGSCCIQ